MKQVPRFQDNAREVWNRRAVAISYAKQVAVCPNTPPVVVVVALVVVMVVEVTATMSP